MDIPKLVGLLLELRLGRPWNSWSGGEFESEFVDLAKVLKIDLKALKQKHAGKVDQAMKDAEAVKKPAAKSQK